MAASNVQIGNRALQKLGASRIESLDEDSPNARSIKAAFESVRKMELRRYAWSFAIVRASVAADGTGPVWGDFNRYSLPNDFIRLLRDNEYRTYTDWKIEGQHILSADAAPLQFKYIANITDPNFYDALFIDEVFSGRLAMEVCEEITQSTSKMANLKDAYKEGVADAMRIGAIEKEAQEFNEDPWLTARY